MPWIWCRFDNTPPDFITISYDFAYKKIAPRFHEGRRSSDQVEITSQPFLCSVHSVPG